jgi:hypothetical protein
MTPAELAARLAPIVVSGSVTATINRTHISVASGTYTDPTPVEGAGYEVIVRNGTATVGGVAYATGLKIRRYFHSVSWENDVEPSWETANIWTARQTTDLGSGALPAPSDATCIMQAGATDSASPVIEGVGYGAAGFVLTGRVSGGTRASPAAITGGSFMLNLAVRGWDGTIWTGPSGRYVMAAGSTWSGTNRETIHQIFGTPNGSTTVAEWGRWFGGALQIGGTFGASPGVGFVQAVGIRSADTSAGIGYSTGAGGTVTQLTNRTTGVTLNRVTGAITLVSAAGSTTYQSFTVTNSAVSATDTIIVNQVSGTDLYETHVTAVGAGSFRITFRTTGGTTTEQPVFRFTVIKSVSA